MTTLRNYIGGEWIAPGGVEFLDLANPATGEPLGKVPLSGTRAVNEAVAAAQTAFLKWREVPPVVRARYLFKLKYLMEEHFEDLAQTVTREHGKTLDESRGSVRRGIENVEHACGIPTLMMGKTLEDVASGIDCEYVRQPLGVFAAITLAAVMCPVTVPDCGQTGVRPATVAGAGVVAVWHSQITMLPFTPGCAKWICACCTVPISPLYESSYSIMPSSRLILASNSPLAGVDTEGTSSNPISRALK